MSPPGSNLECPPSKVMVHLQFDRFLGVYSKNNLTKRFYNFIYMAFLPLVIAIGEF